MNNKLDLDSFKSSIESIFHNDDAFGEELIQDGNDFINLESIDINNIKYLNSELVNLGYKPICYAIASSNKVDFNNLLKNTEDLVRRYKKQFEAFNRSQEQ